MAEPLYTLNTHMKLPFDWYFHPSLQLLRDTGDTLPPCCHSRSTFTSDYSSAWIRRRRMSKICLGEFWRHFDRHVYPFYMITDKSTVRWEQSTLVHTANHTLPSPLAESYPVKTKRGIHSTRTRLLRQSSLIIASASIVVGLYM